MHEEEDAFVGADMLVLPAGITVMAMASAEGLELRNFQGRQSQIVVGVRITWMIRLNHRWLGPDPRVSHSDLR